MFSPNQQWGGGVYAARLFLCCSLFPLQQTTSGTGHRVKQFFQVGDQYAECEKQQQHQLCTSTAVVIHLCLRWRKLRERWTFLPWYSSSRINTPIAPLLPFVPASANLRTRREKYTTIESRQKTRGKQRANSSTCGKHFFFRKVMVVIVTDPDQTAVLLDSPSGRPLLLSLLRRTRELLASSGML